MKEVLLEKKGLDANYRDILPYLRPQPGEVDGWILLAAALLGALILGEVGIYFYRRWREQGRIWDIFRKATKAVGLSPVQCRLLMRIAKQVDIRNPLLVLNSLKAFDRYVGDYSIRLAKRGTTEARRTLGELALIRRTLGFDRGWQIQSTHQLDPGQLLTLYPDQSDLEKGYEYIITAQEEYGIGLAPRYGKQAGPRMTVGDRVEIRFRYSIHVECRFHSEILEAHPGDRLLIKHANHLERLQKRELYRLKTRFDITLYCVSRETVTPPKPEELDLENVRQVCGHVSNISGGGLCISTRDDVPGHSWLIIDPGFKGAFPLAGIACEEVARERRGAKWCLRLRFADLPIQKQNEIVGQINRLQLRLAS